MTETNSMKAYDCIYSVDGKAFSCTEILSMIQTLSHCYANKRGHSMTKWDVEELVGRVEQRVAEKFSARYDSTQGPVRPWVSRIVFNEGNDLLREIIRKNGVYTDYESEISESRYSGAADDELIVSELEEKWQSYLSHLEGDKQDIMQWTRDGLKPAEIAQELGIAPERVHSILFKERKKLERLLGRRQ